MSKRLADIFPSPDDLLSLEAEDIAPLLLEYLSQGSGRQLNRYNFTLQGGEVGHYAGTQYEEVARVVTEAWMVLEREGLLAPEPGQHSGEWRFITRRGLSLKDRTDFEVYRRGHLLPAKLLDSALATKVRPVFLRGDYDTAVFRAFKEVETRVRSASALGEEMIGVQLMRMAFHPENGPLTDTAQVPGERQAVSDLFAGALGVFKNPSSHRDIKYGAEEAGTIIRLADFLLWWVEVQVLLRRK